MFVQVDSGHSDKTAHMRSLIRVSTVCIFNKICFLALRQIFFCVIILTLICYLQLGYQESDMGNHRISETYCSEYKLPKRWQDGFQGSTFCWLHRGSYRCLTGKLH